MNTEKSREDILEAARQLFSRRGYHSTMSEIVQASGRSKGTIYHYFDNKQDLFETMINEVIGRLYRDITEIGQTDAEFEKKLRMLIEAIIVFYREHGELAYTFFMSAGTELKKKAMEWHFNFNEATKNILREGVNSGYLAETDVNLLSHSLIGLTRAFSPPLMKEDYDSAVMVDFVMKLYLEGVRAKNDTEAV